MGRTQTYPWRLPFQPHGTAEANDGTKVTETAGYIPAELQIRRLLEAGQRLDEWKEDLFDFAFNEEVPDEYLPPDRTLGFDPADASEHLRSFDQRFNAWKLEQEALKRKEEDDASRSDQSTAESESRSADDTAADSE